MTTLLDLDPATLGLADSAQWAGDATWGVLAPPPYGPVTGQHHNGLPVLRLAFGSGAPAMVLPDLADVGGVWTLHLVARAVSPADGAGVSIAGTSLAMTADGRWDWDSGTVTDPVSGLRVLTLTCDGSSTTLYLDGEVVGSGSAVTVSEDSIAVLAAGGPGHVWELARFVLLDEVPATLVGDMAALVAQYVSDVVELEATGSWAIAGAAAVTVDVDLWADPPIGEPGAGGVIDPGEPPAPIPPPIGVPDPMIRRRSEVMPAPSLDGLGRPVNWRPTEVRGGNVGRIQIVVEGTDITWLRDAATPLPTFTSGEPFGAQTARIRIPQISAFDDLDDFPWCQRGANVAIRLAPANGDDPVPLWIGVVTSVDESKPGSDPTLVCTGVMFVADEQLRPPAFSTEPADIGEVVAQVLNSAVSRRYTAIEPVVTGCRTSVLGAWEPRVTGFVQQLLATAVKGGRQWTVECEERSPRLVRKDTETISWSFRYGQRGIVADLESDDPTNVIFGEGVGPGGGRWRNAKYPNWRPDETPPYPFNNPTQTIRVGTTDGDTDTGDGVSTWQARAGRPATGSFSQEDRVALERIQRDAGIQIDGILGPQSWAATFGTGSNTGTFDGAFIAPLAKAMRVEPRLYGPDGDDLGANPDYDPNVVRVEDKVDFGYGVSKSDGKSAAIEMLARDVKTGYTGSITFDLDPEEGSRLRLVRPGTNGLVKGFHGRSIKVHVASVTVSASPTGPRVVAQVDTKARDYPTLGAIRQRQRNATDPAKALIKRLTKSSLSSERATFDAESPAGQVPRFALFSNLWSVVRIPFGSFGSIVRTSLTTTNEPRAFATAVFAKPVTAADMLALVGNPLSASENPWDEHADELAEAGMLMAWGWKSQPCGYYPKSYSTPTGPGAASITGRMVDDASWEYASTQAPWLWVAFIAAGACFVEGRFWPGAD